MASPNVNPLSRLGAETFASRVGLLGDCAACKYEDFFLGCSAASDQAMVVDVPASAPAVVDGVVFANSKDGNLFSICTPASIVAGTCAPTPGPKATKALFPDDPSNVHHRYIDDHPKMRILHGGAKEHHIFHLHAHQWVHTPHDDNSSYPDSQAIGPGSSFTLEITYNGSGNRNTVVGDSIFHCHFYPHFARGMWEVWRGHEVFEDGSAARNPLDNEIAGGMPHQLIDATVCLGGLAPPCQAISAPDLGKIVVDYHNEPIAHRVRDPQTNQQALGSPGELSSAFLSDLNIIVRADPLLKVQPNFYSPLTDGVQGQDPYTPLLGAYENDKIQVRILVGAHEEGLKPLHLNSGYRNSQVRGLSEHFNLWEGAKTTIQWWDDPLPNENVRNRTLRTVFTHDHFGPSGHQSNGLYAGLVNKSTDRSWINSTGDVRLETRRKAGPASFPANILARPSRSNSDREFLSEMTDLATVDARDARSVNLPNREGHAPLFIVESADSASLENENDRLKKDNDRLRKENDCLNSKILGLQGGHPPEWWIALLISLPSAIAALSAIILSWKLDRRQKMTTELEILKLKKELDIDTKPIIF